MLVTPSPSRNHLLDALPVDTLMQLDPHLDIVSLKRGQVLYESGDAVRHIYFPIDVIASLIYEMENGAMSAIAIVGNDGVIGVTSFMGGESTPSRAIVVSPGHAYHLASQRLRDEFYRAGPLQHLLLRYIQALLTQMSQTAVCNRHHALEQQLCRWMLSCLDRSSSNKLDMTQELIANMLGVRRESVTEAAGRLHKAGLIDYSRGHIVVRSRDGLEQRCCECYEAVNREVARLLPKSPTSPYPFTWQAGQGRAQRAAPA